jgi:flagellar biosynthetic protein FlhB
MPPDDQGERTEAPTQRRREETRRQGQVARSTDLTSAIILLGALGALSLLGGKMFGRLATVMAKSLGFEDGLAWSNERLGETFVACLWSVGVILLPILMVVMAAAVASNLMQVGILISGEPLRPSLSKISPLAGAKRLFSKRSAVRLVMSLGKMAIIGLVAYLTIASRLGQILSVSSLAYTRVVTTAAELVFLLGIRVGVVLLALAIMDYLFQRWQHEQDLRMTRQEVKEDLKRMEGDPQIRARRQRVARQLAMQRMSREVPKSTVVVTNPTHLAVALLYKNGMNAPRVVAKGADFVAIRIRQIAAAAGVPIVERRPLAHSLFKACEVGDEIPVYLYQAVAEVLAYVYELARHKKIGRRIPASVM